MKPTSLENKTHSRSFCEVCKGAYFPLFLLVIWQLLHNFQIASPAVMPSPVGVLVETTYFFCNGDKFWYHVIHTIITMLFGLILGAIPGLLMGLYIGYKQHLRKYFEFSIEFGRALPAAAVLPPILIFTGPGIAAKITLVSFGVFFLAAVGAMETPHICSKTRISHYKMLGAKDRFILEKIILREAAGKLLTILRITISVSLIISVVSELLIGNLGLGDLLKTNIEMFNPDKAFSIVLFLGTLGYLINFTLLRVQNSVDSWR